MSQLEVEKVGAYPMSLALFDLVIADREKMQGDSLCFCLIAEQEGSAETAMRKGEPK